MAGGITQEGKHKSSTSRDAGSDEVEVRSRSKGHIWVLM